MDEKQAINEAITNWAVTIGRNKKRDSSEVFTIGRNKKRDSLEVSISVH